MVETFLSNLTHLRSLGAVIDNFENNAVKHIHINTLIIYIYNLYFVIHWNGFILFEYPNLFIKVN